MKHIKKESRCIVSVYRGWAKDSKCGKTAGHGKDGLYCRHHAKVYPADEARAVWWKAAFNCWRNENPVPVEVVASTDKQVSVWFQGYSRALVQSKRSADAVFCETREEAIEELRKFYAAELKKSQAVAQRWEELLNGLPKEQG